MQYNRCVKEQESLWVKLQMWHIKVPNYPKNKKRNKSLKLYHMLDLGGSRGYTNFPVAIGTTASTGITGVGKKVSSWGTSGVALGRSTGGSNKTSPSGHEKFRDELADLPPPVPLKYSPRQLVKQRFLLSNPARSSVHLVGHVTFGMFLSQNVNQE